MGHAKFLSLLLVRAGPTEWDMQGRIAGAADLPLTDGAESRLAAAGRPFVGSIAAVLSGPELASQAAARAFGGKVKVRTSDRLQEVGMGLWEGMLAGDIEQRYRSCYREWRADPGTVSIPASEGMGAAQERLVKAVAGLASKFASEAQHVAIVVRPTAWGLLRCWAEGRTTADFWELMEAGGPEGEGAVGEMVAPVLVESARLKDLPQATRTAPRARV